MAGLRAFDSCSVLLSLAILLLCVRGADAFGAGNIASVSRVEGQNWRHGDIEDTLLTLLMSRATNKKFSKLDVKRVYFGNWLRDYSQAVDVGALKMVSADAVRLLLWILGFLSFGFGTREFEVTRDRLGCYRPEEHIDNPKDYADNQDARRYDPRLRGPVDESRELAIDERTGLKNYIANDRAGITTSSGLIRDLYRRCIDLARRARRDGNDDDLYEAFRLLGTANHCLEDFSAHSNYVELCLIEMGERDVFPHVGRRTQVQVQGARERLWPLITGTFGGVDFLHSVCGEISDKATQSEIDELEGTISNAERNRQSASIIQGLLAKLPDGIMGGDEKQKVNDLQQNANTAQMQNMEISPKEPEEFARQAEMIRQQIYPALEFHDTLMRQLTETVDKIPILPDILEQLQEQLNIFVFSLIAPFMLPVIKQVKSELSTGSSEIIESSKRAQHIVFEDDNSSDPTHSMISKDHFSNVLNEPAGKVASQVLKWVVPQIVDCWDDERADVDRTINRIINGVFHHPALRDQGDDGAREGRQQMFRVVESWWREQGGRGQDDLRNKLSRQGVEQGHNHKEGVHDKGHGCGKPLGMPNVGTASSTGAIGGVLGAGLLGGITSATGGGRPSPSSRPSDHVSQGIGKAAGDAVGGGLLGSIVGGVVGGVGGSLLGGAFNQGDEKKSSYGQEGYTGDGGYQQSYHESASKPSYGGSQNYGEASYQQTTYPGGSKREDYSRTERYGDSSERREEHSYQSSGGYRQESRTEYSSESKRHGKKDDDSDDGDDYAKKEKKRREKEEKKRAKELRKQQGYASESDDDDKKKHKHHSDHHHGSRRDDSDDDKKHKHHSNEHSSNRRNDSDDDRRQTHHSGGRRNSNEGRRQGYGEEQSYGGGRSEYGQSGYGGGRQDYSEGRQEYGGGRQEYGSGGYAGGREERSDYGQSGYGRDDSYGGGGGGYGGSAEGEQNRRSHGHGRRDDNEDDDEGRRRRRNDDDGSYSGGYSQGGGYGGGY